MSKGTSKTARRKATSRHIQNLSARATVNQVANLVERREKRKHEVKVFDTSQSAANIGAGATVSALTAVPQGVTQSERVGDQMEFVDCEFTYQLVQANADIYSDVRVIIFQWFPNTTISGAPVLADILPNTAAVGLYSAYNWQYRSQYHILFDKLWSLAGLTTAPTSKTAVSQLNVRLKNMRKEVVFTPGTTNGSNLLWLLTISDSVIAPFPQFNLQYRTKFRDM